MTSSFQAFEPTRKGPSAGPNLEPLLRLQDHFLAQWLQSLRVLLPASVGVEMVSLQERSYAQFLADCPPVIDIEVFEVQAWQALCAWCLDSRWVSAAVDCLFGGGLRLPVKGLGQRRLTAIELGVRRRLIDSLASAYEAAWAATHPIRLQSLRSEDNPANLRMAAGHDGVLHLQLKLQINGLDLPVHACLPLRCLQWLRPEARAEGAGPAAHSAQAAHAAPDQPVMAAPVELEAVLAHTELSVAQLMALSVGQVIELQMHERVDLRVRGVKVASGLNGLRNGRHAVRIESIDAAGQGRTEAAGALASARADSLLASIDLNLSPAATAPQAPAAGSAALGPAPQS